MSEDAHRDRHPDADLLPERSIYLVVLALPAAIWAAHFLATYVTTAVWCARFAGQDGPLGPVRAAVLWYTVAALGGIGLVAWSGFTRHRYGEEAVPHDMDTPGDRHRFLGFATLLLAGLSAVATAYVALSFVFFDSCR